MATAAAAQPRSARYRSLDFWRGLACLIVVISHSTLYAEETGNGVASHLIALSRRGWVGVPIFFVISGYCIMATADATRTRGLPTSSYFYRRFRRIYPPYWIWLVCTALMVWLVEERLCPGFFDDQQVGLSPPRLLTGWQWLGNATLTEVWRWRIVGEAKEVFLTPAWTLCYEEQFYAVAGLALLLFRNRFFGAFTAVSGIVLATLTASTYAGLRTDGTFFDGRWLVFAAGIPVYYIVMYASSRERWALCAALLAGAIYAARKPSNLAVMAPNDLTQSCFVAFVVALLLVFLYKYDSVIDSAVLLRPIRWCGTMCYSLYLVHWPIVKVVSKALSLLGVHSYAQTLIVTIPACVAASLALGWGFHLGVERKFLNPPRKPISAPGALVSGDAIA